MTTHDPQTVCYTATRKLLSQEKKFYQLLAKEYLQYFGNPNPTTKQLSIMQELLFSVWLKRTILFDERLTACEKQCLYYASLGKSIKETATFLETTTRTIEMHRQSIFRKLSCKNIAQAIAVGIQYGLVV